MDTSRPFQDQVFLITGGARRIGAALARYFAALGASICVHCRSSTDDAEALVRDLRENGVRARWVQGDLRRSGDVQRFFREALAVMDGLDVLINNAAVFRRTPVDALDAESFDFHVGTNLRGTYLCCSEAIRYWRGERRGGCIINFADVAGLQPWPGFIPYSISKAGVVSLTQGLAKAAAPDVRVNAIAPGPILPPEDADESYDRLVKRLPLRRSGSTDEIAQAVETLLRNAYITGHVLAVDGGYSLM